MKKFGRLALLLVVIGWFCPVCCNLSGLQWLQNFDDGGSVTVYAIGLFLSVIFAVLGIVLALKKLKSKEPSGKGSNVPVILSAILGLPFFIFMVVSSSLEILNYGAYLMIAGWILSLISIFLKEK